MAGAIAKLSASLSWDLDDFQRGTATVENAFKSIIGIAGDMAEAVANAGKKMTLGLTLPLAGIAVLTTKASADAAELQSAFDFTFGAMAGSMNKWAEATGDAMGRSTQMMQEGAFALGGLFNAAAPTEAAAARMSKQFTELAVDAGSFFNVPFEEALGKIRSGLAGESEPLRRFNVFINEAAVEAKGLELGLISGGEKLNEYGKIMARAALIAEGLTPALGDAERTSGSLSNSFVRLKAQVGELAVEIGQYLEPYAKALANTAEKLVSWFKELPEGVKRAAVGFGVFLAALGPLSIVLSALAITILPLVLVGMGPLFSAISLIVNPIGTLVVIAGKLVSQFAGIGAIIGKILPLFLRILGPVGLLITAFQLFGGNIMEGIKKFGQQIVNAVGPRVSELFARLAQIVDTAKEAFGELMDSPFGGFVRGVIEYLGLMIEAFFNLAGIVAGTVLGTLLDVFNAIAEALQGLMGLTSALISGDWDAAWNHAANIVGRAMIRIGEMIDGIMPKLGFMLKMVGALSGAQLTDYSTIDTSKGALTSNPVPGFNGEPTGMFANAPFAKENAAGGGGRDYMLAGSGGKKKKTAGGRKGRSGPSAEELAERKELLDIERRLAVAREKDDVAVITALERQKDLLSLIGRYKNAGLSTAQARVAAEQDLAEIEMARMGAALEDIQREQERNVIRARGIIDEERALERREDLEDRIKDYQDAGVAIDEARALAQRDMFNLTLALTEAQDKALLQRQADLEMQEAQLRNDHEHIRSLEQERYLADAIADYQQIGYDLASAEIAAQQDLLRIEEARAEMIERRLEAQESARQIELAQLRGDSDSDIRKMEERARLADRIDELRGDSDMSYVDALAQAQREANDRSLAHTQGTFRDAFRNGLQAAMDGNLGDFFENWMRERAFNALSKVLDKLADNLANLISGQNGGGLGGFLSSAFGLASGGKPAPAGGVSDWDNWSQMTGVPKLNTGGTGIIKGHPGIDKNLLSMNGSPVAWVSQGERLKVEAANQNGGGGQTRISVEASPFFDVRVNGQIAASSPAIMQGGAQIASSRLSRRQSRSI